MSLIVDGHAHIFPHKVALRAAENIGDFYHIRMQYDGTVETLLRVGAACGISRFLVHSVATVPAQVAAINNFIAATCAAYPERFIGFATMHPDMADPAAELKRVLALGLRGVKLHPDFQDFYIDEERAFPIYAACENTCPILIHTGDRRYSRSCPTRVTRLLPHFPHIKMICAHFGGYTEWNEAEQVLAGHHDNIWIDTSSSLHQLPADQARRMIELFGGDRVIFGTDYPMWDPAQQLRYIDALGLGEALKEDIFYRNLYDLLQFS